MNKISYVNFRLDILDDFFLCLVDKPKDNIHYEEVLAYILYYYEEGFSEIEIFLANFVIYVLCAKFENSNKLSKQLLKELSIIINSDKFITLVKQISEDERDNFLHDMYLVNLISESVRNELATVMK